MVLYGKFRVGGRANGPWLLSAVATPPTTRLTDVPT